MKIGSAVATLKKQKQGSLEFSQVQNNLGKIGINLSNKSNKKTHGSMIGIGSGKFFGKESN